jgi:hypothetical protein
VLRRVVKDHSDIKNPAMMQRADSVWNLKESGIIRAARALSAMPRRIFCFPAQRGSLFRLGQAHSKPSNRQDHSFIFIITYRLMQCRGVRRASFDDSIRFNHASIAASPCAASSTKYRFD